MNLVTDISIIQFFCSVSSVCDKKIPNEVKDRVIKSIDFREYMKEVCEASVRDIRIMILVVITASVKASNQE